MIRLSLTLLVCAASCAPLPAGAGGEPVEADTAVAVDVATLHRPFARLLDAYALEGGVRYRAWHAAPDDVAALTAYVDRLESVDPSRLDRTHALAYWINLYNAATLELVLAHYPVDSIKDIGGRFRSPWNKKVVRVAGKQLSLNAIENDIIRPDFGDARIHFALNCASIGCPPLAGAPYRGAELDAQLEAVTRRIINDPRWVDTSGDAVRLTKLFDWYREDFVDGTHTVGDFVARYREPAVDPAAFSDVTYVDYDWSLNEIVDSAR